MDKSLEQRSCGGCRPLKQIPLIPVVYANENQSHIKANEVTGTPGVDPVCGAENPGLCSPVACCAPAPDTSPPGAACYDAQSLHQRTCECDKCITERCAAMDSRPCYQHIAGNEWQDLRRKHADPEIGAIHDKLKSSAAVRENLKWCPTDESLSCVTRRFRQYPVGLLGQASVHYGAAQDADYPRGLIHGVLSDEVTPGTKLISPPPTKWVDQLELDIKESVYESNRLRPVGRSHDQTLHLPPYLDPEGSTFGKKSDTSVSAALLVNPPKSRAEIAAESQGHRAEYKFTHGSYEPGEQICRNYEGGFRRTNTFGIPTPTDVAGRMAKKVIGSWRSCVPDPPIVTKVYADHVDFRMPKLGRPQDRNCIRQLVGQDFTFGKKSEIEKERPIRELIFNRCPNPGAEKAAKIMQNLKNWLDRVRRSFRSEHGPDFEQFFEQIMSFDPVCSGFVDWDSLIRAMELHHVPRTLGERDFMEALAYVGAFCNDKIDINALLDLLKGYVDPGFSCKVTTLKPYYCPHTTGCAPHFRTMYQEMSSNVCEERDCVEAMKESRSHGMPSVRKDKLPSKIKSTKDFTNYGDDGDARSLLWPSVYTTNGITVRDAFKPMTQKEMTKVLCLARVDMSHAEMEQVWAAAQALDPTESNQVCYQTFREALCQVREENARICNRHIDYDTEPCIGTSTHYPWEGVKAQKIRKCRNPCAGVDPF